MCGRFTRTYSWREVHDFLNLTFPSLDEMAPSYNVAPTQMAPICRLTDEGKRELASLQWGLIPTWAKETTAGVINARAETAATKPMFRSAFARRRCLVPVSGFYEWKKLPKRKQPFYIRLINDRIMCFAGLWEPPRPTDPPGSPGTFTILTTDANERIRELHDRMPVILRPEQFDAWLDPANPDQPPLAPFPAEEMEAYEVSTRVNSPKNNEPSLTRRQEGDDDLDEQPGLWGAAG